MVKRPGLRPQGRQSPTSSQRRAFVAELLGAPYDRSEYHCWWLARLTQAELFGRDLPHGPEHHPHRHERARLLVEHPERARWSPFAVPEDGDLVLMAKVAGQDIHCGTYLADHRGVFHTDEPHGVVIDTLLELEQVRRWRPSFYRPHPTA